jgi:plasmid stability protein
MQSVTVKLPDTLYQRMRQRARERNRSIEEEVVEVVEQAIAAAASPATSDLLAELSHLTDEDLWQAARMRVPKGKAERMQELVWKQQAEGLTTAEDDEANQLQQYAQRVMLVRAEAAALLAGRGHDVSELISSAGE